MSWRCPHPDLCGSQLHLTTQSRAECRRLGEEATAIKDQPAPSSLSQLRPYRDSFRQREEERSLAEARSHVPAAAPDGRTARLNEIGERQLAALADHLSPIDTLTASMLYTANRGLRLGHLPGPDDWLTMMAGYETYADFLAEVDAAFTALGTMIKVATRTRVCRGIRIGLGADFDPANLHAHVTSGAPLTYTFVDPGFGFATLDVNDALYYAQEERVGQGTNPRPVLMVMDLHSALYIPAPEQRSTELAVLLAQKTWLKDACAQFVIPRDSRWRITSVDLSRKVPLVSLTQL
ncbi:hypothetical protein AB3X52_00355 [Nocardioides sp. DS6]|uniref:Uncharacterized protein n=1 Tax=Nocardioides eburneus TaxID=3231482 RepID=A0ABV3SSY7_9ACTN